MKHMKWGVLVLMAAATAFTSGCASVCRVVDGHRVVVDKSIYFNLNSSAIRTEERADLRNNIANLKANPNRSVILEGNADVRGGSPHNYKLGMQRAEAVKSALVQGGISPSRVKIVSNGVSKAKSECKDESCWQSDRRVDFVIVE